MTMSNVVLIIILVLMTAMAVVCAYAYIKAHTLDEIRGDVYQYFLKAEHMFYSTSKGKQKMDYVVQRARSMLPGWAQFFITDEVLRKVIQGWFDLIKDLLDDGKLGGNKEE